MEKICTNDEITSQSESQPEPSQTEVDQGRMHEADERLPTIDRVPIDEIRVGAGGTLVAPREDLGDAIVGIRSSRRGSGCRFRLSESTHLWKQSQKGGNESLVIAFTRLRRFRVQAHSILERDERADGHRAIVRAIRGKR
jgi:hypothetical protein